MDQLLQLIDRITSSIPESVLQKIRIVAIGAWAMMAAAIAFYSWKAGANSAPQIGQDLHHAELKQRVLREKNLKERKDVVIPDLHDIIEPGSKEDFLPEKRIRPHLGSERENRDGSRGEEGIPYMGEENQGIFPEKVYTPEKDGGTGGIRSRNLDEDGIDLLPVRPAEKMERESDTDSSGDLQEKTIPDSTGGKQETRKEKRNSGGKDPELLPVE